MDLEEDVDDLDEAEEVIPFTYSITAYGADYPVDSLVKRIEAKDIIVPVFSWKKPADTDILGFQRDYVWPRSKADRFIEKSTRKFTNANSQKLKDLLGNFNADWRSRLDVVLVDEFKDAVDSLLSLRHLIAHGGSAGVTLSRVSEYYLRIQLVVDEIADLCAPK